MSRLQQLHEGGVVGQKVTLANSGTAGSDAVNTTETATDVVTIKYDDAYAAHGTKSARIDSTGSGAAYEYYDFASTDDLAGVLWVRLSELPSGVDLPLMWFGNGTTRSAQLNINAAGKLRFLPKSGTVGAWTAAANFPVGQWVRIDTRVKRVTATGTDPVNGSVQIAYALLDSATLIEGATVTGVDTNTLQLNRARGGKAATSSYLPSFWIDDFKLENAPTGLIGPPAATPPVARAVGSPRYRIDARTSTGGAAPLTYTINQTSGPEVTPEPSTSNPGVWSVVQDASNALVYEIIATDANGLSNATTITVPRLSAGTDPVEEVIWDGTNWV